MSDKNYPFYPDFRARIEVVEGTPSYFLAVEHSFGARAFGFDLSEEAALVVQGDSQRAIIFEGIVLSHIGHLVMKFQQSDFDQLVQDFLLCPMEDIDENIRRYDEKFPRWNIPGRIETLRGYSKK